MASSEWIHLFRYLADVSHTISKCILIWAIHCNRSAEGVSLLTQLLYALVFTTRYLDLFWVPWGWRIWNTFLKIFYIGSSLYIVWLMMRVYARTREREYAWKLATWSLGAALVSSPLVCLVFNGTEGTSFSEVLWIFSVELESACVLPQLLLLRQTSVPTVIDSYYLVTLGSYRFFYILNWIVSGAAREKVDPIQVIFGVIQTALYVDFAWVYFTRQRVKLRGGAVVDSEDLGKGFLVSRIIGQTHQSDFEDDGIVEEDRGLANQESGTTRSAAPRGSQRWGARGISVSADDTLESHDQQSSAQRAGTNYADDAQPLDARMADPSQFDESDDDADMPPPPVAKNDAAEGPAANKSPVDEGHDSSTKAWAGKSGQTDD